MNDAQRKAANLLKKAAVRAADSIGPGQTGALLLLIGSQLMTGQDVDVSDNKIALVAKVGRALLAANPQLHQH
jgi:hypothetical protein